MRQAYCTDCRQPRPRPGRCPSCKKLGALLVGLHRQRAAAEREAARTFDREVRLRLRGRVWG